jgi:hypothetical protein
MSQEHPTDNTESTYEMLWRCEFCNTDRLRGKSQRFCPNCGAAQETKNRYFPTAEDLIAVDNTDYQGVDIICPACSTASAANSRFCQRCGSPLKEAKTVELKQDMVSPIKPVEPSGVAIKIILLCLILAGISYCTVERFWNKNVNLELVSSQWQKEIKIEQFQSVTDSSWCDSMPVNAFNISRESRIRRHNKVADGQTCEKIRTDKGDGTFTSRQSCTTKYRDEPVYADKCSYSINRWQYKRSLILKGDDKQAHDPAINLINPGTCSGCEREAAHVKKYVLSFRNLAGEPSPIICEVPENIWQQAAVPSRWTMDVSVISDTAHCASLKLTPKD